MQQGRCVRYGTDSVRESSWSDPCSTPSELSAKGDAVPIRGEREDPMSSIIKNRFIYSRNEQIALIALAAAAAVILVAVLILVITGIIQTGREKEIDRLCKAICEKMNKRYSVLQDLALVVDIMEDKHNGVRLDLCVAGDEPDQRMIVLESVYREQNDAILKLLEIILNNDEIKRVRVCVDLLTALKNDCIEINALIGYYNNLVHSYMGKFYPGDTKTFHEIDIWCKDDGDIAGYDRPYGPDPEDGHEAQGTDSPTVGICPVDNTTDGAAGDGTSESPGYQDSEAFDMMYEVYGPGIYTDTRGTMGASSSDGAIYTETMMADTATGADGGHIDAPMAGAGTGGTIPSSGYQIDPNSYYPPIG